MSSSRFFIGVDPGVSGAAVAIDSEGKVEGVLRLKNSTDLDIFRFFKQMEGSRAVLEKVNAMPGGGQRKMGATSAFTFGQSYGALKMALVSSGVSYQLLTARNWQKLLGITFPKNTSYADRKKILRGHAERLFPSERILSDTADAYLLSYVARRVSS